MDIAEDYKLKRVEIKHRLLEFTKMWNMSDERIFAELCFCICTPQSKAKRCWEAISKLYESGALFRGTVMDIAVVLKSFGVRFYNVKARRIIEAKRYLPIKKKINVMNTDASRDWLVKHIKGIGYKEASHFLRNIGVGEKFAILDRHIMRNLVNLKLIPAVPKNITVKRYHEVEDLMRGFARKSRIPMGELDLLFWSMETGAVFK